MNDKILIASPIRDREWVLNHFIDHIVNIDYPRENLGHFYVINGSSDNSEELIKEMYNKYRGQYKSFDIMNKNYGNVAADTRYGSRRHIYPVLTDLRNTIKDYFLNSDYDYLFTIDSDILVKPNVLKELLKLDTLAASALICNDKNNSINGCFGNAMYLAHNDPIMYKFIMFKTVGDVFEADLSGAITLYKKELFERGFHYKDYSLGEDILFCHQLYEAGIKFKIKKGLANHIMTPKILEGYLNEKH